MLKLLIILDYQAGKKSKKIETESLKKKC